jgi:hypothetical protein
VPDPTTAPNTTKTYIADTPLPEGWNSGTSDTTQRQLYWGSDPSKCAFFMNGTNQNLIFVPVSQSAFSIPVTDGMTTTIYITLNLKNISVASSTNSDGTTGTISPDDEKFWTNIQISYTQS